MGQDQLTEKKVERGAQIVDDVSGYETRWHQEATQPSVTCRPSRPALWSSSGRTAFNLGAKKKTAYHRFEIREVFTEPFRPSPSVLSAPQP